MKMGGHPIDLMVDMGIEHSVVSQPVGPFPRRHTNIIGAIGDWALHPFSVSR
jgi:hypothetical protein